MFLLQVKILLDYRRDSSRGYFFFFLLFLLLLFPLFWNPLSTRARRVNGEFLYVLFRRSLLFFPLFRSLLLIFYNSSRLCLLHLCSLFLLLLCTLLYIVVFLQHISKQRCGKVLLVRFPVRSHPQSLPLGRADTSRLQLLAVDGGGTQAFARLGTEYCHTLDAVQINLLLIATKNIHLQVGLRLCHGIILLCQFLTHTLDIVHRLLQGGEEMIQVAFVGIDGKALLALWLDVECPPLLVILHQLHIVETDVTAMGHGFRGIQRG